MSNKNTSEKGVIYTRVSSNEQKKKGYSLKSQEKKLKELMERDGVLEFCGPISDVESGRSFDREGLNKLLELASTKLIKYIYVYGLDRLGRNVVETPYLMYKLKEQYNVIVRTIKREYNFNNPLDFVIATLECYPPDEESCQLSERTQRGKIEAFKQGKWVSAVPLGYRKNDDSELEIIDSLEKIIIDIFKTYFKEGNMKKVMVIINNKYSNEKIKLTYNQIRSILRNPIYKGYPRYGNVEIDAPHLAMITPELYDKVQTLLQKNNRRSNRKKNNMPRLSLKYIKKKWGHEYTRQRISILKPHCPICDEVMVHNGPRPLSGYIVDRFICRSKKCKHQRDVPNASEIKHFIPSKQDDSIKNTFIRPPENMSKNDKGKFTDEYKTQTDMKQQNITNWMNL